MTSTTSLYLNALGDERAHERGLKHDVRLHYSGTSLQLVIPRLNYARMLDTAHIA